MDFFDNTSTVSPTTVATSSSPSSSSPSVSLMASRKRVKLSPRLTKQQHPSTPEQSKWRNPAQERIYRRRLLEALRSTTAARHADPLNQTGQAAAASTPAPAPGVIKEAADSALALTAQGQSRWSRAILSRRWRMRKMVLKAGGKMRRRKAPSPPRRWGKQPCMAAAMEKSGKVNEKLRLLSCLVPGCRKASTPSLLEETADYVAALELQVKAMRALADALSSTALSSSAPFGAPPNT